MAFWMGFLTILTLGIYRFWMKSRLRRWYWSAIRPGGIPLEYVGLPAEKLLGFLVAVVILAFYIGVVNLILMFVSFSLLANNFAAYAVSLAGVVPIWFFARYRARRYVLARTRWRGIRFGLEPGAWGYAIRALGHWFVTILSLGVLWPRMTFGLEKYRTDRTYFGSARLHQGGHWQMLWPSFVHVLIGAALSVGSVLLIADHPNFAWLLLVSIPWFLFGLCYYRAGATQALAQSKGADGIGLASAPEFRRLARIYLFGGLGAGLLSLIPAIAVAFAAIGIGSWAVALSPSFGSLINEPVFQAVIGFLVYVVMALIWTTLRHVFIVMPLWRHYAETLTVTGARSVGAVQQRARDNFEEAEGFAEALDVGAAI